MDEAYGRVKGSVYEGLEEMKVGWTTRPLTPLKVDNSTPLKTLTTGHVTSDHLENPDPSTLACRLRGRRMGQGGRFKGGPWTLSNPGSISIRKSTYKGQRRTPVSLNKLTSALVSPLV